jgi:hypothetical protein
LHVTVNPYFPQIGATDRSALVTLKARSLMKRIEQPGNIDIGRAAIFGLFK